MNFCFIHRNVSLLLIHWLWCILYEGENILIRIFFSRVGIYTFCVPQYSNSLDIHKVRQAHNMHTFWGCKNKSVVRRWWWMLSLNLEQKTLESKVRKWVTPLWTIILYLASTQMHIIYVCTATTTKNLLFSMKENAHYHIAFIYFRVSPENSGCTRLCAWAWMNLIHLSRQPHRVAQVPFFLAIRFTLKETWGKKSMHVWYVDDALCATSCIVRFFIHQSYYAYITSILLDATCDVLQNKKGTSC